MKRVGCPYKLMVRIVFSSLKLCTQVRNFRDSHETALTSRSHAKDNHKTLIAERRVTKTHTHTHIWKNISWSETRSSPGGTTCRTNLWCCSSLFICFVWIYLILYDMTRFVWYHTYDIYIYIHILYDMIFGDPVCINMYDTDTLVIK